MDFLHWSKKNAIVTVTYVLALQYSFLLVNYGIRFMAHVIDGSVCTRQIYPYFPNQIDDTANMTRFRNSNDFGMALGLSLFLSLSTIAFFIVSICLLFFFKYRVLFFTHARVKENRTTMLHAVLNASDVLFFGAFTKCLGFTNGFFVAQSVVHQLAKLLFYTREFESKPWLCSKNIDSPTQQFLSLLIINIIAFAAIMLAFSVKMLFKPTSKPLQSVARFARQYVSEILQIVFYVVIARWFATAFVPLLADAMFPNMNIHLAVTNAGRNRFQLQCLYEFVASILVACASIGLFNMSLDTSTHLDIAWTLREAFVFSQAVIWGSVLGLSLIPAGAGMAQTPFYPTNYPGELLASTVVVSAILAISELVLFRRYGYSSRDYDLYRTVLFTLVFGTALPIAYALSNDILNYTAQSFGHFGTYPVPENFSTRIWVYQGLLVANSVSLSILFGMVVRVIISTNDFSSFFLDFLWISEEKRIYTQYMNLRNKAYHLSKRNQAELHTMLQTSFVQNSSFANFLGNCIGCGNGLWYEEFVAFIQNVSRDDRNYQLVLPLDDTNEIKIYCEEKKYDSFSEYAESSLVCVFPALLFENERVMGVSLSVQKHDDCWSYLNQFNDLSITGKWYVHIKIAAYFQDLAYPKELGLSMNKPLLKNGTHTYTNVPLYEEPANTAVSQDEYCVEYRYDGWLSPSGGSPPIPVTFQKIGEHTFETDKTHCVFRLKNAVFEHSVRRTVAQVNQHAYVLGYNSVAQNITYAHNNFDPARQNNVDPAELNRRNMVQHMDPEYLMLALPQQNSCYLLQRSDSAPDTKLKQNFIKTAKLRGFFGLPQKRIDEIRAQIQS